MNRDIKKRKEEEEDKSNGRMEREFLKNHSRSMVLSSFSHLSSPRPEFFFPSRENESVAINYFRDSTELRGGDRSCCSSISTLYAIFFFIYLPIFLFFAIIFPDRKCQARGNNNSIGLLPRWKLRGDKKNNCMETRGNIICGIALINIFENYI